MIAYGVCILLVNAVLKSGMLNIRLILILAYVGLLV